MARIKTTETTVYTWDELSDSAKDTARQEWNRFLWEDGSMQESMECVWEGKLLEAGWVNLSDLAYDLYSQGGMPTWTGTLPAFEHGGHVYAMTVTRTRYSGYGFDIDLVDTAGNDVETFYGTPEWDAEVARIEAAERAARDFLHSLSADLLAEMQAEDEYQCSDEMMAETSESNGYEYDEDGHLS